MLRKQAGMGKMAAEWVPGCQSKLSLFLQRSSGYLFPSCPQWSLGAREPQVLALSFGMNSLSSRLHPGLKRRGVIESDNLFFCSSWVWICPCFSLFFFSFSPSFCLSPAQSSGRTERVCLEALPVYAPHSCPSPLAVRAMGGGGVGGRWHGASQPRTISRAFCTKAGSVSPALLSHSSSPIFN